MVDPDSPFSSSVEGGETATLSVPQQNPHDDGAKDADDNESPYGTFICFPALPFELRDQIWKAAVIPRLIHWRPGGAKLPGVVHACLESRTATQGAYVKVELKHLRFRTYNLFINYDLDILYRKQEMPESAKPHRARSFVTPEWCRLVTTFAINVDKAAALLNPCWLRHRPIFATNYWLRLKALFPKLENLVIILHPNLEPNDSLEGLVEVDKSDLTNWNGDRRMDLHEKQLMYMGWICKSFVADPVATGDWRPKLTFMRVPDRRQEDEVCDGVWDRA